MQVVPRNPINATQWQKEGDHSLVRQTTYMEIATLLGTSGCSREHPWWTWSAMGIIELPAGIVAVSPGDWILEDINGNVQVLNEEKFYEAYAAAAPLIVTPTLAARNATTAVQTALSALPEEFRTVKGVSPVHLFNMLANIPPTPDGTRHVILIRNTALPALFKEFFSRQGYRTAVVSQHQDRVARTVEIERFVQGASDILITSRMMIDGMHRLDLHESMIVVVHSTFTMPDPDVKQVLHRFEKGTVVDKTFKLGNTSLLETLKTVNK